MIAGGIGIEEMRGIRAPAPYPTRIKIDSAKILGAPAKTEYEFVRA
jgi:hypothetical protein